MNVLLIDVGNTNIKIGIASKNKLLSTFVIPTDHKITADSFGIQVYELCKYAGYKPKDFSFWLISSVVPPVATTYTSSLSTLAKLLQSPSIIAANPNKKPYFILFTVVSPIFISKESTSKLI